jgi:hypothetical protein
VLALAALGVLIGCRSAERNPSNAAPPPPSQPARSEEPGPVKKVEVEIVVAAWAEPSHLGYGGGETQILVRVQKRGGAPFPGVEVSLGSSEGTLFSGGRVLVTDARGMTRDRLTTHKTATVTLNAGGTRYRFSVAIDPKPE